MQTEYAPGTLRDKWFRIAALKRSAPRRNTGAELLLSLKSPGRISLQRASEPQEWPVLIRFKVYAAVRPYPRAMGLASTVAMRFVARGDRLQLPLVLHVSATVPTGSE